MKKLWLLPCSDYGWVFVDKYNIHIPIYETLILFSMFQMDYEPLDGSVVSIDSTLNDGFVADDLNVSSFEETDTLELKPHSNGVDNENEPISTSTAKKPTKTQQQLTCEEAGCSYQTIDY